MDDLTIRGFGREIGYGKNPAVLVIDMMRAFTDKKLALGTNLNEIIPPINTLLESAHENNVPVYFTVIEYIDPTLSDAGIWYRKMKGLDTLRAGTPAVEIDPQLELNPDDYIILKKYASAFFGTDLVSRLNSIQVDTLILAGCTTSGCVRATAVDAVQYGYIPIVVEEAVSDRLPEAHQQSLIDLQMKYADVKSLDEVIKYLGGLKNE